METTKKMVREFLTWLVKYRDFEFFDEPQKSVIIFLEPGEYVLNNVAYRNGTPLPFQDGDVPWKIIWAK